MSFYDAPPKNRLFARAAVLVILLAGGAVITLGIAVSKVSTKQEPSVVVDQPEPPGVREPANAISAPYAVILTNHGPIYLELFEAAAPRTVKNFATLAANNYYNGLTFHRVVKDFVIQGGDPKGDGSGGVSIYGDTFADEINPDSLGLPQKTQELYTALYNYQYRSDLTSKPAVVGALAMANQGKGDTNRSQFFIISNADQPSLNGKHTVFGQVVEGMEVVAAINQLPVGASDRPIEKVEMLVVLIGDDLAGLHQKIEEWRTANQPAPNEESNPESSE